VAAGRRPRGPCPAWRPANGTGRHAVRPWTQRRAVPWRPPPARAPDSAENTRTRRPFGAGQRNSGSATSSTRHRADRRAHALFWVKRGTGTRVAPAHLKIPPLAQIVFAQQRGNTLESRKRRILAELKTSPFRDAGQSHCWGDAKVHPTAKATGAVSRHHRDGRQRRQTPTRWPERHPGPARRHAPVPSVRPATTTGSVSSAAAGEFMGLLAAPSRRRLLPRLAVAEPRPSPHALYTSFSQAAAAQSGISRSTGGIQLGASNNVGRAWDLLVQAVGGIYVTAKPSCGGPLDERRRGPWSMAKLGCRRQGRPGDRARVVSSAPATVLVLSGPTVSKTPAIAVAVHRQSSWTDAGRRTDLILDFARGGGADWTAEELRRGGETTSFGGRAKAANQNDRLFGEDGSDVPPGTSATDLLDRAGTNGDDLLYGGPSATTVLNGAGGEAATTLFGGPRQDVSTGGNGHNHCLGRFGRVGRRKEEKGGGVP